MMKHIVTGGAGFMGSHLTQSLLDRGDSVTVIDNLSGGFRENVPEEAELLDFDLVNARLVDSIVGSVRPDRIWHLAAYAAEGLSHWVRGFNYSNNMIASANLITAALKYDVEHFTFTSSMAVYGNQTPPFTEDMTPAPEDPYGIAKYSVEQDLAAAGKLFGLPYTIFRPHNVYGPGQNIGDPYRNVVGIFMRKAMLGEPLAIYGDGLQTRAFSYISDIIDPMVSSLDFVKPGRIYNIGGEHIITILELAQLVAMGFPGAEIIHLPERYEVKHAHCKHRLAHWDLGFSPKVSIYEGLPKMKRWAEEVGIRWSKTPTVELRRDLPSFWREIE